VDDVALADAILKLLANDALRGSLAANAKKRVEDQFPLDLMVQKILNVYRSEPFSDSGQEIERALAP
jgi:glycosyltransferase involved in cell wall biosynthesis